MGQKTYTLHHANYRNQDVYDPCGGPGLLRVDAAGRLRGLSRDQAAALLRSPAWSMEGGAEVLAFEAACVDLAIKLQGLRDVANAFRSTARAAVAAADRESDLQRALTREMALRGLPDIDLGAVIDRGMFDGPPAAMPIDEPEPTPDESEGGPDDEGDEDDGLTDEDKRRTGEIDPDVLAAEAGDDDADQPDPTPNEAERKPPSLNEAEVEALHTTLAEMPWRARVSIAEAMGETISGAGASQRALDWLMAQPPSAVAEAMQNLKL